MADAGQFAQDADILLRVGTKANATVKGAGWFDTIIVDVEAVINCFTRYDWSTVDAASAFNSTIRGILIDTGACLAAIQGISWDMSGFTSRIEAEDMVNILRDIALRNISILRDKKTQAFLQDPTKGTV
ncbi:hypothetical protein LCGC14_1471980 [marine sediment metagenome]|uniref:Uncharacterized protein n=1 Tax=marine sediment metagenome TaxID=412755 RepID=A0A0F9JY31_9ZZZZ